MAVDPAASPPFVFATVGTDHHPFDRLVAWVDEWSERQQDRRGSEGPAARCLVQYGTSVAPRSAEGVDYTRHDVLVGHVGRAAAVVCHGGPATITDCHRAGLVPIVVPRTKERGEHVDDHQVAFTRRLAAEGKIDLAADREQLFALLDARLVAPGAARLAEPGREAADTVRRFGELVGRAAEARRTEREERRSRPSPAPPGEPVRVALIGGLGRSGSTLLERMLAQVPGFAAVGELVHIWRRGLLEGDRCGCGEPFHECPFWTKVGDNVFGGWEGVDGRSMLDLQSSVDRNRFIPFMVAPWLRPAYKRNLASYATHLAEVYRAARDTSGADVVIDSSKHASYGFLLRRVPGLDVRVLHLVRDARGVAFSWMKTVEKPETLREGVYMARFHPAKMSGRWVSYNLLFHVLRLVGVPTLFVRYEDLVTRPHAELGRIMGFLGRSPGAADLAFVGDGAVELMTDHSVAGNPMRFKSGRLPLRPDEEWRRSLGTRHRTLVTAATAPLLARYGYLGRRSTAPKATAAAAATTTPAAGDRA